MAQLSNDSTGRGFTHVSRIDLDSFNEISGNATQTLTLFTGDNAMLRSALILVPDNILADGVIQAQVGDAGAANEFILGTTISGLGSDAGVVAVADLGDVAARSNSNDYNKLLGNPGLAIDTNFDIKAGNDFDVIAGGYVYTIAADTSFDTGTTEVIAADKFGVGLCSVTGDGTTYVTWFSPYDDEAAAIAAAVELFSEEVDGAVGVGFVTVQTGDGVSWTAGTDALETGTGGTPSVGTNYYNYSPAEGVQLADHNNTAAALSLVANGKEIDTSVTCSLALSTGDWSSNNGAEFFVLLDIATPELLAK